MKALEILNLKIIEQVLNPENREKLYEAISELEDLQNRSCNNCKYNKEQDGFMIFCDKEMCQDGSKMMWHSFTKDFCCKYWELKNEK